MDTNDTYETSVDGDLSNVMLATFAFAPSGTSRKGHSSHLWIDVRCSAAYICETTYLSNSGSDYWPGNHYRIFATYVVGILCAVTCHRASRLYYDALGSSGQRCRGGTFKAFVPSEQVQSKFCLDAISPVTPSAPRATDGSKDQK